MPSQKLSADTAKKLGESALGPKGLVERVRRDYSLELDTCGATWYVRGNNKELVEMGVDALDHLANDTKSTAVKSLGPYGSVVWSFRDKDAKHIVHLFKAELEEIRMIKSVQVSVTPDDFNPMHLEVKCDQNEYELVKKTMHKLQTRVATVVTGSVRVQTREKPLAKEFEKRPDDGQVYSRLIFGKEIIFFGKIFAQVQAAMAQWESFREQGMEKLTAQLPKRNHSRVLPIPILNLLRRLRGGIKPIIERVRNDFLLDVDYNEEEEQFKLMGDNLDVVQMAYDVLCSKVSAPDAKVVCSKALGTRGTVIWAFKDNQARHFKHLFLEERKMLHQVQGTFVRFSPNEANPLSVEIKCEQVSYDVVNSIMQHVDNDIKLCKSRSINLEVEEQGAATKFEKRLDDGRFYCRILFSGKEMTFFGRNDAMATFGITEWEEFKRRERIRQQQEEQERKNQEENMRKEQQKKDEQMRREQEKREKEFAKRAREQERKLKEEEQKRIKQEQMRLLKQKKSVENKRVEILGAVKEDPEETTSADPGQATAPEKTPPGCPVCHEAFTEIIATSKRLLRTRCDHIMCQPCAAAAVAQQGGCPVCRKSIAAEDLTFVTLFTNLIEQAPQV